MKRMFQIFAFLYMVGPLLFIPYWAYINDNWYLLFGIPFSWFGSFTTFSTRLRGFIFLFTLLCLGVWLKTGFSIHQYLTFFFFCSLGGYLLAQIAEQYDQQSKRGTLDNDAELRDFMQMNPEYIQNRITEWLEKNPGKQLTYEAIDSLARGKEVQDSDLMGQTLNQMTDNIIKKYIASNPPELKIKIAKWKEQNPGMEVTDEIIYALAANKKGTLKD